MIREEMYEKGTPSEHWSYVQDLDPSFCNAEPTGEVLGFLVKQYAIAYQLVEDGYEYQNIVDTGKILWVKYTENYK